MCLCWGRTAWQLAWTHITKNFRSAILVNQSDTKSTLWSWNYENYQFLFVYSGHFENSNRYNRISWNHFARKIYNWKSRETNPGCGNADNIDHKLDWASFKLNGQFFYEIPSQKSSNGGQVSSVTIQRVHILKCLIRLAKCMIARAYSAYSHRSAVATWK